MQTLLRALAVTILAVPALAFSAAEPPPPAMQALPEIKGVLSWNTLAQVKQTKVKNRILTEFSKEITALNNREVKLQGFMMPLEPGDKQKHFLLSLTPPSCSYCMPAGPEGVVEVKSKTPIKYTFDPIIVSGKMSVLKDDPMGMYYRLTDAAPASIK